MVDLAGLTLAQLRALNTAVQAAIAASVVAEGECAIRIDDEGVSVTFTILIPGAADVAAGSLPGGSAPKTRAARDLSATQERSVT